MEIPTNIKDNLQYIKVLLKDTSQFDEKEDSEIFLIGHIWEI